MTYNGRLLTINGSMSAKVELLNEVVFREKVAARPFPKLLSLFPGIGFGAYYKISQRVYCYSGQGALFQHLQRHYDDQFAKVVGQKRARHLEYAVAGSLMGIGEVILLPLDTLKIISQTNSGSLKARSFFTVVQQEGFNLYRGGLWTAMRNAPGSLALFGGSALVKEQVFKLEKYSDATMMQEILASTVGSVGSLVLSSPCDVIKARLQRQSISGEQTRGRDILASLLQREGPLGLFKGLTTKIMVVAPKMIFSLSVFNQVMSRVDRMLKQDHH